MSSVFIIDTNVVVAGLLASHAESPVVRILDGMLRASFRFVVSEALLAEYRSVLLRPKLLKLHRLTALEVDVVLTDLARHAIVLPVPLPTAAPLAPDPGDQFLWNLLTSREDLLLVTGDKLLLQAGPLQKRVMAPQTFVAQL
ncbi:MAG: putative toxin-antitoxin system toxin component, PIN family [Polaromonas sp. 24-62-144]|uniref:putative toxin-antitoxin system toxin component, PIN family n=1 Tax=Polaromonas sp. TaxID=1869339 RepID=UPI000BD8642A|nr:putative toxin-antitoxin system toxin component, PIN family [Polaromonas sp.]OYY53363.1 MAG: putative toxin-antitoxin system toxin component, PIN family [Polaromonas sp. 35-63-240]OYZ03202.1 MAG: putative toxin-antitoxin system toxin component, PIN family [Polaromonas sp. 28-63-22]OYZ84699.1 MAG: putative toxin-antitoxin system toxin component, PIN family [Polaromonas sp. 24-62-144]HQS30577.1 putative toxin-antitoxin system toxin component, PIN family [Polaromonas sp.]